MVTPDDFPDDFYSDFYEDAVTGLSQPQKALPSKYLYDTDGSELFDHICTLPEYYPTRTEALILRENLAEIATALADSRTLLELGSGSGEKAEILLKALPGLNAYVPFDISQSALSESERRLTTRFPKLRIAPVCGDYTASLPRPDQLQAESPVHIVFLGSTFGNFEPQEARRFLSGLSETLGPSGKALIGVDLIKDRQILENAYNDSAGVTAAFNLNLLNRMNRELGASFDVSKFRHKAVFNEKRHRIEMHLECKETHEVTLPPGRLKFLQGETIHTENSYKFDLTRLRGLARNTGLEMSRFWTDKQQYFAVVLLKRKTQDFP